MLPCLRSAPVGLWAIIMAAVQEILQSSKANDHVMFVGGAAGAAWLIRRLCMNTAGENSQNKLTYPGPKNIMMLGSEAFDPSDAELLRTACSRVFAPVGVGHVPPAHNIF